MDGVSVLIDARQADLERFWPDQRPRTQTRIAHAEAGWVETAWLTDQNRPHTI